MPINVVCPNCFESFRVADGSAGRKGRCGKCRHVFVIPTDEFPTPEQATLELLEGVPVASSAVAAVVAAESVPLGAPVEPEADAFAFEARAGTSVAVAPAVRRAIATAKLSANHPDDSADAAEVPRKYKPAAPNNTKLVVGSIVLAGLGLAVAAGAIVWKVWAGRSAAVVHKHDPTPEKHPTGSEASRTDKKPDASKATRKGKPDRPTAPAGETATQPTPPPPPTEAQPVPKPTTPTQPAAMPTMSKKVDDGKPIPIPGLGPERGPTPTTPAKKPSTPTANKP